ncbi:Von Willebrand factor type A domain protein [Sulfitobacter geojensis]|nr:Von Willebrand factor type A domain protein [Sulfitobacter geojensis]NYI28355.1 hypothetical protein [Sulfitobacter geojensis]
MKPLAALVTLLMAVSGAAVAECRLALVLALDVSSSVDPTEDALQRGGVVAALTAPEVAEAFFATDQHVALAVYEWSGREQQDILLDWTLIDGPHALLAAAETVAATRRGHADYPTAMGHALGFGVRLLEAAPPCARHTLDMAGDGQNNEGFGPQDAYNAYPFDEVTVNGLVVNAGDFEGELGLIPFYRAEVLHGRGAFLEIANGFADYERAMRRKLVREVTPVVIGRLDGGN